MAFWNISANQQVGPSGDGIVGFASGTDVDQGSIRYAGAIAETTKFTDVALGEGNPIITLASGVGWIDPVNSSTALASRNGGDQVIVRVTSDIAGLANTTLLAGASNSANTAQNPHQVDVIATKLYKTAFRNNQWNAVSGVFDPAVTVVTSGGWDIAAGADDSTDLAGLGTDIAANPTQDEPGQLVYHYGSGAEPTQDLYEAKNLW